MWHVAGRALVPEHFRPGGDWTESRPHTSQPHPLKAARDTQGDAALYEQGAQDQSVVTGNVTGSVSKKLAWVRYPCRTNRTDDGQDAEGDDADNKAGKDRTTGLAEHRLVGFDSASLGKQVIQQAWGNQESVEKNRQPGSGNQPPGYPSASVGGVPNSGRGSSVTNLPVSVMAAMDVSTAVGGGGLSESSDFRVSPSSITRSVVSTSARSCLSGTDWPPSSRVRKAYCWRTTQLRYLAGTPRSAGVTFFRCRLRRERNRDRAQPPLNHEHPQIPGSGRTSPDQDKTNPRPRSRRPEAVSAGGGRCWVRTNVG